MAYLPIPELAAPCIVVAWLYEIENQLLYTVNIREFCQNRMALHFNAKFHEYAKYQPYFVSERNSPESLNFVTRLISISRLPSRT